MPKKRFSSQYSKPPSTVHPSLNSSTPSGQLKTNSHDVSPTVNELLNSSRKAAKSTGLQVTTPTPTLPPQIRHLLAQPETPSPSPRSRRRRVDADGRRLPAGPPPPRSWLERSRHAPEWMKRRGDQKVYPRELSHLPGLQMSNERSLQSICMREMARHWEYVRDWEQNNLAELPTRLRMELLSHIAIDGPDNGIGFDGLNSIVMRPDDLKQAALISHVLPLNSTALAEPSTAATQGLSSKEEPDEDWDAESPSSSVTSRERNEGFFRLDLSGSMGNSISFRQLATLIEQPDVSLSPPLPHLTHLSLSHPSSTISWRNLLSISKHLPFLTHLSLAYWPTPTLTPNSRAAVMSSQYGKDIQYGGTHFYSHTLDNDFREAADVLRRLANRLYNLEYLDFSGCAGWFHALIWTGVTENSLDNGNITPPGKSSRALVVDGIDWRSSWLKLSTLKVNSDVILSEDSNYTSISSFAKAVKEVNAIRKMLSWWVRRGGRGKRGVWVDVVSEDPNVYGGLWQGISDSDRKNRGLFNLLSEGGEIDSAIRIMTEILDQDAAGLHGGEEAVESTHMDEST